MRTVSEVNGVLFTALRQSHYSCTQYSVGYSSYIGGDPLQLAAVLKECGFKRFKFLFPGQDESIRRIFVSETCTVSERPHSAKCELYVLFLTDGEILIEETEYCYSSLA